MRSKSLASFLARRSRSRLVHTLGALAGCLALGTAGFSLIEGWPLADSLYMAVIITTTIGYGEVLPLSPAGRGFTIFFMLVGAGTAAYALSSTVQALVQSEIVAAFGARRRHRGMSRLHDHYIICGAGRVGARIIREFERAKAVFIVIEKNEAKVAHLIERGVHVLVRDATLEETLREAGVDRARGLVTCLPDDAENLYVVLTARDLNRDLHIVTRAVEEQAEPKLVRAGANRVVAPTIIGSHRMAQALMKPAVADFMDSIAAENLDLGFEQVELAPTSVYVNHKLRFTNIRSELDVVIVALRRRDGEMIFNPSGDAVLEAGDLLVAIGRAESLAELNELARGTKRPAKP